MINFRFMQKQICWFFFTLMIEIVNYLKSAIAASRLILLGCYTHTHIYIYRTRHNRENESTTLNGLIRWQKTPETNSFQRQGAYNSFQRNYPMKCGRASVPSSTLDCHVEWATRKDQGQTPEQQDFKRRLHYTAISFRGMKFWNM